VSTCVLEEKMNIFVPRTAVIGVGRDGLEAARQLICDGTVETCPTGLGTGRYKPDLEVSGVSNWVFIAGTIEPDQDVQALLSPALPILSDGTLNIALISTMCSKERSRLFNPGLFCEGIMTAIDACFVLHMTPRLFNADDGNARINALSNAGRIILEMMTVTDNVMISFDEFKETMVEAGQVWLSTGIGSGMGRAIKAARSALIDSFSGNRLVGAQKILLRIAGGDNLLLSEVHDVLDTAKSVVPANTDIIFGVARKPVPDPLIKISLLATHFSAT